MMFRKEFITVNAYILEVYQIKKITFQKNNVSPEENRKEEKTI